jgi:lipopolysaccharide export system protein LptA
MIPLLAPLLLLLGSALTSGAQAQTTSNTQASPQPSIHITATNLQVNHATGHAEFNGKVVVKRADLTLTAEHLETTYTATGLGEITARGNVTITRQGALTPEIAQGDVAVFNPRSNLLTLSGNQVTLSHGASRLQGDKLVYDLKTQQARVTQQGGPVQATFTPEAPTP